MMVETPVAAALNHLLGAQSWARERLAPFCGKTIELRMPPFPDLRFVVLEDGLVQPIAREGDPSLAITFSLAGAPGLAGDAALAEAVNDLMAHLRWDAEDDLSRLVGDIAARRLAQAGRDFSAWQADAGQRLGESVAAYLTDEKRLLVQRPEFERFAAALAQLRSAIERLQERARRLE